MALALARFNVSKDGAYGRMSGARGRGKGGVGGGELAVLVKHAIPASTLSTFPDRLGEEELLHFHRWVL